MVQNFCYLVTVDYQEMLHIHVTYKLRTTLSYNSFSIVSYPGLPTIASVSQMKGGGGRPGCGATTHHGLWSHILKGELESAIYTNQLCPYFQFLLGCFSLHITFMQL